ncbi:MAG: hypothetical protein DRN88_01425 [Candidatus Hydrothermarchaeota archaeon]|nr:MAG: hypothetical protein DRN88_01425 [Candidatus Hydrothermarchaeota archaeon]
MKKILILIAFLLLQASLAQYDLILVRNDLPQDWAIAQSYAHKEGIPILTTSPEKLDSQIKVQLIGYKKSGFNKILIIGGEKAISRDVQQELNDLGFITHRIYEGDRYGTSARVAIELFPNAKTVVMVNGASLEDLLLAQRIALRTKSPILLVKKDSLPVSVANAVKTLGIKKIYLVSDIDASFENLEAEVVRVRGDIITREKSFATLIWASISIAIIVLFLAFHLKTRIPYAVLTKDEEKIIRVIEDNGGEITQDKLPELTNFSRPKISRLVSELVERGIIEKSPYGRTQKLKIRKKF